MIKRTSRVLADGSTKFVFRRLFTLDQSFFVFFLPSSESGGHFFLGCRNAADCSQFCSL